MRAQRFDSIVGARELGLGQCRVDLAVTDVMQQHHWTAFTATQFRN